MWDTQGCSSIGRALVSKTSGCGFKSLRPCQTLMYCEKVSLVAFSQCFSIEWFDRMATKEKAISVSSNQSSSSFSWASILPELFHARTYKRSQGRTVRMVTAVTLGIIFALSAARLYQTLGGMGGGTMQWALPGLLLFGGWWVCFRLINIPKFADFLIAVEAEMSKVSWPTRTELYRASVVVILFIFSLAALLFLFDFFWQSVFRFLGILD